MTYKQLIHMEPEEISEDARLLYVCAFILDQWRRMGFHEGPRALDTEENVWVKTKLLRHPDGLWQFSDASIEAGIQWLVATWIQQGITVNLDVSSRLMELKG